MTSLRICMLSVHTCPLAVLGGKETGGMNVYVRELTREWGRRGHQVDVYTRNANPDIPAVSQALGPTTQVIHVTAGPTHPIPKEEIANYVDDFVAGVLQHASGHPPYDVIYSHYWLSGLVALKLRERWRTPFVQMFHTLGKMKNQVAANESERASERRITAEQRLLDEADHIVAGSPMDEHHMVHEYGAHPDRITVIPPGVDMSHFYPRPRWAARTRVGVAPATFMILYVGRIEPLKGLETLLRAVKHLSERCCHLKDITVVIIGGDASVPPEEMDAEMKRLLDLRDTLGLQDLVTFLGKQGQDVLPDYYSAADVVVMPSYYESFGMVALEAMACETPVVASKVGGLLFTVIDGVTGYHVPSGDPEALAQKLECLMTHPEIRHVLGQHALHAARHYAWPYIGDRVLELFQQLMREHPQSPLSVSVPSWKAVPSPCS